MGQRCFDLNPSERIANFTMSRKSTAVLRSTVKVSLVGIAEPLQNCNRVPTNREILQAILFQRNVEKKTFKAAVEDVASFVHRLELTSYAIYRKDLVKRNIQQLLDLWRGNIKNYTTIYTINNIYRRFEQQKQTLELYPM